MTAVIFLGPSLPVSEAKALFPKAIVRGPARQGDVLEALREGPRAIVLIDGVFESQPSVWHQELRIALSEGVHVLGASSMGALRAAELAPFGMVGIGEVYAAYAEGRLVDDADVALLHASAEHDHRPLTVPFVNVVAIAELAVSKRFLKPAEARALVAAAREVHYQDRRWPDVLARLPWSAERRAAFEAWRRANPRDVKADDARLCVRETRRLCEAGSAAPKALPTLSVWARRAWLDEQGTPPETDGEAGLRTMLLAEWARSLGLAPPAGRVEMLEKQGEKLALDPGLRRRFAEALALEELVLARPGLLLSQAPSLDEGRWLEALRRGRRRVR